MAARLAKTGYSIDPRGPVGTVALDSSITIIRHSSVTNLRFGRVPSSGCKDTPGWSRGRRKPTTRVEPTGVCEKSKRRELERELLGERRGEPGETSVAALFQEEKESEELFARDPPGFLRRYSQSAGIVLKEKLPAVKTSPVADVVHRLGPD